MLFWFLISYYALPNLSYLQLDIYSHAGKRIWYQIWYTLFQIDYIFIYRMSGNSIQKIEGGYKYILIINKYILIRSIYIMYNKFNYMGD